jgi:hypothetical protein
MIRVCLAGALLSAPVAAAHAQEPIRAIEAQAPQAATPNQVFLPANTEVVLAMNDTLTTKGGNFEEGHMFYLTVAADVKIGGYVVIPKGARGAGEVTWKTGKAVFGKSGKMEVELRYVEVGGQRINVEGKYRQEGEGNTVAAVGAAILAAPLLFVTGKSATIPKGRELTARTRDPIPVILPAGVTLPPEGVIVATPAATVTATPAPAE